MENIVVVKNKNGSISCLPVSRSRIHYEENYNVIVFVNKMWNLYHIEKIKKYFDMKEFMN